MHLFPSCALLLLTSLPATAQQWSRFHGPAGLGVAFGPQPPAPTQLEDARWRVELPGAGHSSPVLWGTQLIALCAGASDGERLLVCLDATNGARRWEQKLALAPAAMHSLNSAASVTPCVDAERVYLACPDGAELVALAFALADGEPVWRATIGPFGAQHGHGASPVLAGGVLLVTSEHELEGQPSCVVGLEPASGAERWRLPRTTARASYATPVTYELELGETRALLASTAHGLACIDPASGALLWERPGVFTERTVASPVLAGSIVFQCAGSGGGGKESVAFDLMQSKAGEPGPVEVWRMRRALPYVPTGVSDGERILLANDGGVLSCLNARDGSALWQERVEGGVYACPILAGKHAYLVTRDGLLLTLELGDAYKELARVDLGEPCQATPAVANGVLVVRTARHLIAFGGE